MADFDPKISIDLAASGLTVPVNTLNKLGEQDGSLTWNGVIFTGGGGASTWEQLGNKPTSTVVQIDAAVTALHSHTNKSVIDLISMQDNAPLWNGAAWPGSGTGGDMSKSVYDTDDDGKVNSAESADSVPWSGITGGPTSSVANIDSAVTNSHTHSNKTTLDAVTEAFTTALKSTYDGYATTISGKQDSLGFTAENSANKGIANGYASLDSSGKLVSTQRDNIKLDDLSDVTVGTPSVYNVIYFNGTNFVCGSLDSRYIQPNQEVTLSKLYVGEGNSTTDKYIFMNIGTEPISNSPAIRYKIDDQVAKTGHFEISNDGENWIALGQSNFTTAVSNIDNLANETITNITIPSQIDSTATRVISIYCKEEDPENPGTYLYVLYNTSPSLSGLGFEITNYPSKIVIKNTTGETKSIQVVVQYMTDINSTNATDIISLNGLMTLFRKGNTQSTIQTTYTSLYSGTLFGNFERHESVLYIGLVELVSNEAYNGNCRIEISDGSNTAIKELGTINNTNPKYTNLKLDVSHLTGNNTKWTLTIYGKSSNVSNTYSIRRVDIKAKPKNVCYEDFISERNINLAVSSVDYYTVDTFNFYGGYKIAPDSYFLMIFDYSFTNGATAADISVESKSGAATRTAYTTINNTKNIGIIRVQSPATIENTLSLTLKAKVSTGEVTINTCHIFLEF